MDIKNPSDGSSRHCKYRRENGTYCKAKALHKSLFCFFHDPAVSKKRAAARKAGGVARTRKVTLPANLPFKQLQTMAEVVELLGETINQVRRGELDLRISNAIGYLSGILLNAIEKRSFAERLAALETIVGHAPNLQDIGFPEESGFEFVPKSLPEPSAPNRND